jgi:hypothetical protein
MIGGSVAGATYLIAVHGLHVLQQAAFMIALFLAGFAIGRLHAIPRSPLRFRAPFRWPVVWLRRRRWRW